MLITNFELILLLYIIFLALFAYFQNGRQSQGENSEKVKSEINTYK